MMPLIANLEVVKQKNPNAFMAVSPARRKKSARKKTIKTASKNERTKRKADKQDDSSVGPAAPKQNPKAFVFSTRGKAKKNQARSAERDQRRLHGIFRLVHSYLCYFLLPYACSLALPGIRYVHDA